MANISLYDITEEFAALEKMLFEDGGEIGEESEALEKYASELLQSKTDAMVHFVQKMKDEEALADQHIKRLQDYKKARTNAVARLESYAILCLEKLDKDKVLGLMAEISTRKPSKAVSILDVEKIPAQFITVETVVKVDKKAIADAIKKGESVTGAELIDGKKSVAFKLKSASKKNRG